MIGQLQYFDFDYQTLTTSTIMNHLFTKHNANQLKKERKNI